MKCSPVRQHSVAKQETHLLKVRGVPNFILSYYENNSAPAYQRHHLHVLFRIIESIKSHHEQLTPQLSEYCNFYLLPDRPMTSLYLLNSRIRESMYNRVYSLQSPHSRSETTRKTGSVGKATDLHSDMTCQFRILAGTTIVYPE